jgi:predicted acetyltransferase
MMSAFFLSSFGVGRQLVKKISCKRQGIWALLAFALRARAVAGRKEKIGDWALADGSRCERDHTYLSF